MRVESVETVVRVDSVVVETIDTVREVTTVTIQTNDKGDTLRISTVTDRERVRDRSQLKVKSEELKVKADTVYVEKETNKTVAVAGPGTEIDEQGNITKKVNRVAQTLKWGFLLIVAIIALIILIRIKR